MKAETRNERRWATRLEPPFVRVKAVPKSDSEMRIRIGNVLDASSSGLAFQVLEKPRSNEKHIREEEFVTVQATTSSSDDGWMPLGDARVTRVWDDNESAGLALQYIGDPEKRVQQVLLSGIRQEVRVEKQAALAVVEIDKIHAHAQYLHECQLKLFLSALAVGAALGAGYLALVYHSSMLTHYDNALNKVEDLKQWRLWMAALPGVLAYMVALMVATKIASVARNESLLAVLKDCQISGRYPREYRGWEAAYRKLKFIWHSAHCARCAKWGCGASGGKDKTMVHLNAFGRLPRPNVFHVVLFGGLGAIIGLSALAVVHEVQLGAYQDSVLTGGVGGALLAIFLLALLIYLLAIHLGPYSFTARRKVWRDILQWCPYEA